MSIFLITTKYIMAENNMVSSGKRVVEFPPTEMQNFTSISRERHNDFNGMSNPYEGMLPEDEASNEWLDLQAQVIETTEDDDDIITKEEKDWREFKREVLALTTDKEQEGDDKIMARVEEHARKIKELESKADFEPDDLIDSELAFFDEPARLREIRITKELKNFVETGKLKEPISISRWFSDYRYQRAISNKIHYED